MLKTMRIIFVLLGVVCFWSFVWFLVLCSYLTNSVMHAKTKKFQLVGNALPQGWAFFTRSPRETQTFFYKIDANNASTYYAVNNAQLSNFWGLKRTSSRIMYESADIFKDIKEQDFTDCRSNLTGNKALPIPCVPTSNKDVFVRLRNPVLNGEYVLILQPPIPWSWSKDRNRIGLFSKAVRVTVKDHSNFYAYE